jgi:hypothetical protein
MPKARSGTRFVTKAWLTAVALPAENDMLVLQRGATLTLPDFEPGTDPTRPTAGESRRRLGCQPSQ